MHVPARSLASAGIRKSASGLLSQLNRPRLHTSTTAAASDNNQARRQQQTADQMADQPRHTNRLAKEPSPYLLQHAHNPVSVMQGSDGCIAAPAHMQLLQPATAMRRAQPSAFVGPLATAPARSCCTNASLPGFCRLIGIPGVTRPSKRQKSSKSPSFCQ